MIEASEMIFNNKWEREIGNLTEEELLSYNLVINDLKEVALKDLQFKSLIEY